MRMDFFIYLVIGYYVMCRNRKQKHSGGCIAVFSDVAISNGSCPSIRKENSPSQSTLP
ncbi:unnamed protein product [Rhodiola kirilowii]